MVERLNVPRPASKNNKVPPPPPVSTKQFEVVEWDGGKTGEKIIIYADSGMGKTTLSTMAPKPVFIGLDDGGRKIKNPITGENLRQIPGVDSFSDMRAALQQTSLYDDYETVVIDTITILEELAAQFVIDTIPNEKGVKMSNLPQYGWNNGFRHLYDVMKLVLMDCNTLVDAGKNVILIAQAAPNRVPNAAGEDYLREGPRLTSRNGADIEALYCEWADHIFRIGYRYINVSKTKAETDKERAIFVHGEAYFRAKSRTISPEYPVITFAIPADDSVWKFLFGE